MPKMIGAALICEMLIHNTDCFANDFYQIKYKHQA